ncbi:hypothetical protein [Stutzerimonas stutzeri]|uniref:hypothetical protein n=1 Tax=Stutzerimonas stutzeri TaxID=316 RepID=UPI0015E4706F|nr:hypothetical protein [Stutzerimonas stutzeri]MBA1280261.1 hypothetical protein [Stutzerimonas stutzeri]
MATNVPHSQYPLRKPVRAVAGKWQFADAETYRAHIASFAETVERNSPQAHTTEFDVYAVFSHCRVLVASVDPLAVTHGMQVFIPDAPLTQLH